LRAAHWAAGGGEYQPEHRGTADGRRHQGRPGVLRLLADRPARDRLVPGGSTRLGGAAVRGAPVTGRLPVMLPATLVIPTTGRDSLAALLTALRHAEGPRPYDLVVVDDSPAGVIRGALSRPSLPPITVLRSGGRGPAAARNAGWRQARTTWVSFLDDDVLPEPDWFLRLADDLRGVDVTIAGIQGAVRVPLPHRPATDWERVTAGLADSDWITADMTYRRAALVAVGGFDER